MRLECGLVYDQLGGTGEGLVKSVSIGGSLEAGNAWPSRSAASYRDLKTAGSVFFTTDTLLGPLFLADSTDRRNRLVKSFSRRLVV